MKKFELTDERHPNDSRLRGIRALRDIPGVGVAAGDLGGFVESEANLSQVGDCWVFGSARVSGSAWVTRHNHVLTIGPVGGAA